VGNIGLTGNIEILGNIQGLANAGHSHFAILANTSESNGHYIKLWGPGSSVGMEINYGSKKLNFENNLGTVASLDGNGKMTIGTSVATPPTGFRLAVQDGIITQQVKVCASASAWCDYVFDENYDRNSLDYIDAFVKKNKHLPNVPSAKEVEENGINIAEMDATLLRQIEELWLHVIDLKKENESLKKELEKVNIVLDK